MASLQPSTGLCVIETFSDSKEDKGVFKRIRKENRLTQEAAEKSDGTPLNDILSTARGFNCPDVKLTASKYLYSVALLIDILILESRCTEHTMNHPLTPLRLQDTLFGVLRKIATARSILLRFESNFHQMFASVCKIW